ncbi:hypothetical protein ECANGB1_50 [Enterospora canceri]|uniref:Uncharacterized protein n=1 Tax=Enterospora canceri TaxID=1081671 RepID=A0A1Y1S948_9MICR|nr:hypothetical protein ECANGB1_50 [Enterospora canceri]
MQNKPNYTRRIIIVSCTIIIVSVSLLVLGIVLSVGKSRKKPLKQEYQIETKRKTQKTVIKTTAKKGVLFHDSDNMYYNKNTIPMTKKPTTFKTLFAHGGIKNADEINNDVDELVNRGKINRNIVQANYEYYNNSGVQVKKMDFFATYDAFTIGTDVFNLTKFHLPLFIPDETYAQYSIPRAYIMFMKTRPTYIDKMKEVGQTIITNINNDAVTQQDYLQYKNNTLEHFYAIIASYAQFGLRETAIGIQGALKKKVESLGENFSGAEYANIRNVMNNVPEVSIPK